MNLAYKSLYASITLQRAVERREEYYELPETSSRQRDVKIKKIVEADKRIAEIKKEIYNFNNNNLHK